MSKQATRFIRQPEVISRTGRSRTTIWRDVRAGLFPAPVSIGPRAKAWVEAEIEAWQAARIKESRAA